MGDPKPGDVVAAIGAATGPAEITQVRAGGICWIADVTITADGGSPVSFTGLRLWSDRTTAESYLSRSADEVTTTLYFPEG